MLITVDLSTWRYWLVNYEYRGLRSGARHVPYCIILFRHFYFLFYIKRLCCYMSLWLLHAYFIGL